MWWFECQNVESWSEEQIFWSAECLWTSHFSFSFFPNPSYSLFPQVTFLDEYLQLIPFSSKKQFQSSPLSMRCLLAVELCQRNLGRGIPERCAWLAMSSLHTSAVPAYQHSPHLHRQRNEIKVSNKEWFQWKRSRKSTFRPSLSPFSEFRSWVSFYGCQNTIHVQTAVFLKIRHCLYFS